MGKSSHHTWWVLFSHPPSSEPPSPSLSDIGSIIPHSPSSYTSEGSNNKVSSQVSTDLAQSLIEECLTTGVRSENEVIQEMPLEKIMGEITGRGCRNMLPELDLPRCQNTPFATGRSGNVYQGMLRSGQMVAVTCVQVTINETGDARRVLKRAARELDVWSQCSHPNVLPLLGVAPFRKQLAMVSPWMHNGSLACLLSSNPPPLADRFKLCCQVAEGVAYLHEMGIVHGDIKGSNILVSDDFTPVLADFGNAVIKHYSILANSSMGVNEISFRWTPPEVIEGQETPTTHGDIYALGMTILETISGSEPYAGLNTMAVLDSIMARKLPERPEFYIPTGDTRSDLLWALLNDCWAYDPQSRPAAMEVHGKMLQLG